jgi:hypothetical protein
LDERGDFVELTAAELRKELPVNFISAKSYTTSEAELSMN